MQQDLDKLWRRKRQRKRVLIVIILAMAAAMAMVAIRSCSDVYQEPYNKDYRPMDTVK